MKLLKKSLRWLFSPQTFCIGILVILGLSATGCTSLLFTLLYLIKGPNTPAEFKGLKGKKVVIGCRTVTTADVTNEGVPRELAHKVNYDFKKNIRKIQMVDQAEVDKSLKKKMYRIKDFRELGTEFDTDYVIGVELERFQTASEHSPGNYQGRARFIVKVFDMNDEGRQVFNKTSDEIVYPPNSVIDSGNRDPEQFRREFVNRVALHVGKYFYSYNPHDFVAEDARAGL